MTRFIVMDRTAKMPSSCWGRYRHVAVVETDLAEGEPKMISDRSRGVIRIVRRWENQHVGSTDRCAYSRAYSEATKLAALWNQKQQNDRRRGALWPAGTNHEGD